MSGESREVVVTTTNHHTHHSATKFSTFRQDSFSGTITTTSNHHSHTHTSNNHTTTAKRKNWVRGSLILNRWKRSPKSTDKHNNEDYLKNFHSAIQDAVDDDFEFKRLQRRLKESQYCTLQGSKMVVCKYFEGNDGGKYMV